VRWLKKALGRAFGVAGRKAAEELVMRGYIASREGRLDDAQAAYDDACDADETLAIAFFNAGTTELARFNRDVPSLDDAERGARLARAEARLEQALALDDLHAPSWRALARVRERNGAVLAAHAAWSTVVSLLTPTTGASPLAASREGAWDAPESPEASEASASNLDALAEARREVARLLPRARLEEARARAREALSVDADDGVTNAARRTALDALLLAWTQAEEADVPAPRHLFALAGALARKCGDLERARALLDDAVRRDKHDLEAWKELATVCIATGDARTALAASMAAYREDPVDAGLVCNVGVCHLALGDRAAAREFIELARGMAPDDAIVQRAVAALAAAPSPTKPAA
jgi:tetratricopeptide (TPR) repeat protein